MVFVLVADVCVVVCVVVCVCCCVWLRLLLVVSVGDAVVVVFFMC